MARRVLIVDDNAAIRNSIATVLELSGYGVVAAENGAEAIRYSRRMSFDLVVTDIRMPRADGFETIRAFRETARDIPIIAMSGEADPRSADYLRMSQELGADAILRKPFGSDALLPLIERLIEKSEH